MADKERVTRKTVKDLVGQKIMAVAHLSALPSEEARLFEDLGMGPTVRRAMALPYSRLSNDYGGQPISQTDAGALTTVGDSIDLVHKRANA
jgi:hypothetical protein